MRLKTGDKVRIRKNVALPRVLKHVEKMRELQQTGKIGRIKSSSFGAYQVDFGNKEVYEDVYWFDDELERVK